MTPAQDRANRLAREPMRPASPPVDVFRGTAASVTQIWQRRSLLGRLVKREIRARYKDSILGLVWSLARPLVNLLIYYLVIGRVLGAWRSIPDFAIYVFAGLTIWQLFSESVTATTASIVSNSGIIKKIQLPREIFPLAAVGGAAFNFFVQFCVLIAAVIVIRPPALSIRLLYVPMSIVLILVWVVALGLFLSAMNVYLRDVQYLVEVALMIGMWASPIVYSWAMVAEHVPAWLGEVYLFNPVTLAVNGFQKALWAAGADSMLVTDLGWRMLASIGVGLIAIFLSQRVFALLQRDFAQEL